FGNLGGQFGFQGGRQGTDLVTELVVLVQTVVDPGFWTPDALAGGQGAAVLLGQANPEELPVQDSGEEKLKNRMMFNVSTRSMVILGRSRQHRSSPSRPLIKEGMVAGPGRNPEGRAVVREEPKPALPPQGPAVVGAKPKNGELLTQNPKPKDPVDAERIWKQAATRGLLDPGKVIACADLLAQAREFKNAAELLKASLSRGITPERWYQEALAIALEESQGPADEIERARLSAVDLDPKNAQAFLSAAKFLNETGNPDVGVRLCQHAAKLEPNVPDAYIGAMACADNPKATASYDVSAFAAGGLLSRDWDSADLHNQAREHLMAMVRRLSAENKKADAEKVQALVEADKNRDLVIELSWEGDADLDLRVKEPVGTECSFRQPATTGGGAHKDQVFDATNRAYAETYSAARAFSGNYTVTVYRTHGATLGNKAKLTVTRHKGTKDETVEYLTVVVDPKVADPVVTIPLEGGRRTDLAVIPSPMEMAKYKAKPAQAGQVMNKLRALASGAPSQPGAMAGGTGAAGRPMLGETSQGGIDRRTGDITWSTRLGAERFVGLDIRSETTIRADGKAAVKAAPVFDGPADTAVKIDLIPGAGE
ncbi:MAG TPA: hypothetical protein VM597_33425, partial [Gemmataceae bacterium]|nr:hypothetical protein [Gemmataceae bacterium]